MGQHGPCLRGGQDKLEFEVGWFGGTDGMLRRVNGTRSRRGFGTSLLVDATDTPFWEENGTGTGERTARLVKLHALSGSNFVLDL